MSSTWGTICLQVKGSDDLPGSASQSFSRSRSPGTFCVSAVQLLTPLTPAWHSPARRTQAAMSQGSQFSRGLC